MADRNATGVIDTAPANDFGDRTKGFTAFVVVEPWLPAPGPPSVAPAYEIRFENLDALAVEEESSGTTYPLGFGASLSNYVTFSPTREPNGLTGHPLGGGHSSYAGFASQFFTPDGDVKKLPPPPPQDPDNALHYRFMGTEIQFALPSEGREGTKLTFSSGSAVIKLSILDIRTGTCGADAAFAIPGVSHADATGAQRRFDQGQPGCDSPSDGNAVHPNRRERARGARADDPALPEGRCDSLPRSLWRA